MNIVRFVDEHDAVHYGVFDGEWSGQVRVIDGDVFGSFSVTDRTASAAKLLSPVDPPNVIAIGLNYRDHAEESGMPVPKLPLVFVKLNTSVIGTGDAIELPASAPEAVDYEAELCVVIGTRCRNIEPGESSDYILGYTCGNDVSARDCQLKIDGQWARGKSFDTFCPLGPWIVTGDALDPSDLAIKTTINGEILQNSRTSQLVFGVPELVSFLSKQFTLLPGTVIMTGTPPGVGFARKPPRFLKTGDQVVVEIEGIGQLTNVVTKGL